MLSRLSNRMVRIPARVATDLKGGNDDRALTMIKHYAFIHSLIYGIVDFRKHKIVVKINSR